MLHMWSSQVSLIHSYIKYYLMMVLLYTLGEVDSDISHYFAMKSIYIIML